MSQNLLRGKVGDTDTAPIYYFVNTATIQERILIFVRYLFLRSADGNYEVRYKSNVLIYPDGEVLWVPPAIYQVSK